MEEISIVKFKTTCVLERVRRTRKPVLGSESDFLRLNNAAVRSSLGVKRNLFPSSP
jgi:hypothetical protein